jgi:NADH-quinone oxidoreductase subunit D
VERLAGSAVPERAEYLRVIAAELNRISSHAICVGVMAMDIGAITPFPYLLRERETINDLLEALCGARLTYNYFRIGGVSADLPAGWADKCRAFLDHFDNVLPEFDRLITDNEIFVDRCASIGAISADEAVGFGLVGPNLRASGVDFDLRRDAPYSVYDRLSFDVAVGAGAMGTVGDCWDRFWVRCEEMKQSARIVRQCLEQLPAGPVYAKPKRLRPTGEAMARVESARGDMLCYVVGAGQPAPERVHFRTGSFNAMQVIRSKSRGVMVADLVALIASLDVIAPEIDR